MVSRLMALLVAPLLASCINLPDKTTYFTGCPAGVVPQRLPKPPTVVVRESEDGEDAVMTKEEYRAMALYRAQAAQTLELLFLYADSCKPKEL